MTQEDLVAKCNLLKWDISRSTLAKIESQVRRITDEEVALLAKALKVEVSVVYKKQIIAFEFHTHKEAHNYLNNLEFDSYHLNILQFYFPKLQSIIL